MRWRERWLKPGVAYAVSCNRCNAFSTIANVGVHIRVHVFPLCSRALKSSQHSLCSLLIVDTPGFQNPRLTKRECGATFEDLCHNYTQERLQTLFYQRTFVQELERYKDVRTCAVLFCVHAYCLILIIVSFFLLHLFFSRRLCLLLSLRYINSNSVCVHTSDTLSLPPVTSCDKPK